MGKYKKVRCIGFCIEPGKLKDGKVVYLGAKSADLDMEKRCAIMKNAVMTAYKELENLIPDPQPKLVARGSMNVINTDPVLTIFMAPEFFFRGADGAYPVEKISKIMPALAKHTQDPKYEDWLFVYGTAIGYQDLDQTITKVAAYEVNVGESLITADYLSQSDHLGWSVREYVKATVKKVEKNPPDGFRVVLETKDDLARCDCVSFVHGTEAERTEEFDITSITADAAGGTATIIIRERTTPIEAGWAAEVFAPDVDNDQKISTESDGIVSEQVTAVKSDGNGKVQLTLATQNPPGPGANVSFTRQLDGTETRLFQIRECGKDPASSNVTLTIQNTDQRRMEKCPESNCKCSKFVPKPSDPEKCNTCNHYHAVDPIRAGWTANLLCRRLRIANQKVKYKPGRYLLLERPRGTETTEVFNTALVQKGGGGAREILVYKRKFSNLDYLDGKVDPSKHEMHGEERNLAVTEKMPQTGGTQTKGSDVSGDPVFDLDGCTIGLEICLDHGEGRLRDFYQGPYGAGKPKPQILLIPSWGMRIGWGPVFCEDQAVLFNVDGDSGKSTVRVFDGKYGCDDDLSLIDQVEKPCPVCIFYLCQNAGCDVSKKNTMFKSGGGCPECGQPLTMFQDKLKKIGTPVTPAGGPTPVELHGWDWWTVTSRKYFSSLGSIVIYPEKPIPKA